MSRISNAIKGALAAAGLIALIPSCASIGTPSGGPRDEDPPRFVSSNPIQGAVEFNGNKAVLTFDELINVKDAFNKVVVSPPGGITPRVSSLGRRVTVEFRDTLLPNTTYTVDFGDAIVDNNEGNKLENFIYTFSTGPVLDSLMISGMVLGADDLEPQQGMYVGLHTNLEDSAFTKTRFDRIAKTDDYGRFVIGGLAPGTYRVFALEDKDGDLAWSSPEESLAFYDVAVSPYTETVTATDSIFDLKTGAVDSVVQRVRTRFLPNNILLRSYNTGFQQQYITKYERIDSTRINFIFNAAADTMPDFEAVLPNGISKPLHAAGITERSATNDTITFWLTDEALINSDTLRIATRYLRADSLYNMVPVNDTLRLLTNRPKTVAKKDDRKKGKEGVQQEDEVPMMQWKTITGKVEINTPLIVETPVPLAELDTAKLVLEIKKDTVWTDVTLLQPSGGSPPPKILVDTLNPRQFIISYPWEYEGQYRLRIDSLAARNIYDVMSEKFSFEFKIRPESEYGSIHLNIQGINDTIPAFVELLDGGGKPIRRLPLVNRQVEFPYVLAGTYYARIVEDANGNGKFDPGIYQQGIQPDLTYYYPESIELKQNWSQSLDWNVFATPVDKMKPEKLVKNKPKRN